MAARKDDLALFDLTGRSLQRWTVHLSQKQGILKSERPKLMDAHLLILIRQRKAWRSRQRQERRGAVQWLQELPHHF